MKSLIFKTQNTHQSILILTSGINRVDGKCIESLVGEKIVKADAEFTRQATGFAIGGIPPLGHAQKINFIFIDKDLLQYADLWAAAGAPDAVFQCKSQDLVRMTGGRVVRLAVK